MARISKFQSIVNERLLKISEELDQRDLSEISTTDLMKMFQDTAKLREEIEEEVDETTLSYAELAKRRSKG
jgi:hypothetical protein